MQYCRRPPLYTASHWVTGSPNKPELLKSHTRLLADTWGESQVQASLIDPEDDCYSDADGGHKDMGAAFVAGQAEHL